MLIPYLNSEHSFLLKKLNILKDIFLCKFPLFYFISTYFETLVFYFIRMFLNFIFIDIETIIRYSIILWKELPLQSLHPFFLFISLSVVDKLYQVFIMIWPHYPSFTTIHYADHFQQPTPQNDLRWPLLRPRRNFVGVFASI